MLSDGMECLSEETLDEAELLGQLQLRLSRDLAGDPKHIYKHKIRQESAPSRGS